MLPGYLWMPVLGCLLCCSQAFILGATSMCVIWGPVVGGRVLSYRTALLLQVVCHLVGSLVFGPLELLPYSGIIKPTTRASFVPEFVIYALLCVAATLQLWHLLAFWRKVPVSPFAALASSLAGTALIFPGASSIDWGSRLLPTPPYISGLGPVFVAWCIMPVASTVCVAGLMLSLRRQLRADDAFYQVLWRLPSIACFTTITWVSYILYALVAPYGFKINTLTPQAVVLVLCVSGIAACVVTTFAIPTIISKFGSVAPPEVQIKRMNLLGLSSEAVSELTSGQRSGSMSNALQRFWRHITTVDIFADVGKDEKLMQMHSSAEQFDPAAERLFIPLQIVSAILLSLAYGGNLFRSAIGIFGAMLSIYHNTVVLHPYPVAVWLRCLSAIMTAAGAIVGGGRLMPVTAGLVNDDATAGVQLAKMTPFRSYVVLVGSCITSVFAKAFGYDAFPIYVSVSAIMAVGLTEGVSHVNWRKFWMVVAWWYLGCLPVFAITAFFNWQGTRAPSAENLSAIRAEYDEVQASIALLANVISVAQPSTQAVTTTSSNPNADQLNALTAGIQSLLSAYSAVSLRCSEVA